MSKRKTRQPRPQSDQVWNMTRPYSPETALELGQALAAGESVSPSRFKPMGVNALNEALEAGNRPATYQPVVVEHVHRINARTIQNGQAAKHPDKPVDWKDGYGKWEKGMYIAPHGALRRCHQPDVTRMVYDREDNVVTLRLASGEVTVILGTSDDDGKTTCPAILNVISGKSGNYSANIEALKRTSLAQKLSRNAFNNLVGFVNTEFVTETFDDGSVVVWGPGQMVEWGYIRRGGKNILTPHQIRLAVEKDNFDGMTVDFIDEPIAGEGVTLADWYEACEKIMKSQKDESGESKVIPFDKAVYNLRVQSRTSPTEAFPFGFFGCQLGIVPCFFYGDDIETEMVRIVVGTRVGVEFCENKREAKRRLGLTAAALREKAKAEAESLTEEAAAEPIQEVVQPEVPEVPESTDEVDSDISEVAAL